MFVAPQLRASTLRHSHNDVFDLQYQNTNMTWRSYGARILPVYLTTNMKTLPARKLRRGSPLTASVKMVTK